MVACCNRVGEFRKSASPASPHTRPGQRLAYEADERRLVAKGVCPYTIEVKDRRRKSIKCDFIISFIE